MESLPSDVFLEFPPNTLEDVRKIHGLDAPGAMKNLVDEFEEWVKNQKHFLKRDFSRHYLETSIILCKGSLEKAKYRLNLLCTYRTEWPTYFGNFDIKNDFKELDGVITATFLPKLAQSHTRVIFIRNVGKQFEPNVVLQCTRMIIMMLEYQKYHDYGDGLTFVIDLYEVSLIRLLPVLNLRELHEISKIVIDAYGTRVKGIHIISPSRLISVLTWIVKKVIPAKIASRIHFHGEPNTLNDYLPRDILPKEYGGEERSFESLHNDWINVMASEEFRSCMLEMTKVGIKKDVNDTVMH